MSAEEKTAVSAVAVQIDEERRARILGDLENAREQNNFDLGVADVHEVLVKLFITNGAINREALKAELSARVALWLEAMPERPAGVRNFARAEPLRRLLDWLNLDEAAPVSNDERNRPN